MENKTSDLIDFYKTPDEFNNAVLHTAEDSGFSAELIEKDYLCSLVLAYLYSNETCPLIFKGGTLLAKAFADFYRLSEDLDFTLPVAHNAKRTQRSHLAKPIKQTLLNLPNSLDIFKTAKPLKGSNESRQYNMELSYQSQLSPRPGKILIEIGLREELLLPPEKTKAKTLLIDPFLSALKVKPIEIISLSKVEAYAEKTRAALCRKKLAIRDFYDLNYARAKRLIVFDNNFANLVKEKIAYESHMHNFNDEAVVQHLNDKIKTELEPTLKPGDIVNFDLKSILEELRAFAGKLR